MQKVRLDKWLWSVRIFKTRTISTKACKAGKIKIGEQNPKPSFLLQGDEIVQVRKEGFNLSFKVIKLINKRVGAPLAIECYENQTSDDELNKYKSWFIGKASSERREKGAGRPTKRERREIDEFKDDLHIDYFDFDSE